MTEHPFSGKTFLVADDERFSRAVLSGMLERLGATVWQVADGVQAMTLLAGPDRDGVDGVLLDYEMPGRNGLQVLKAIRTGALGGRRNLIVLMLTANTQARMLAAALALDVDAFLAKPLTAAALRARLEQVLAQEHSAGAVEDYLTVFLPGDETAPAPRIVPALHRRVRLDEVREGAVLAADLVTRNGNCLLVAGQVLNARLLEGLHGLQAVDDPIDVVCVAA